MLIAILLAALWLWQYEAVQVDRGVATIKRLQTENRELRRDLWRSKRVNELRLGKRDKEGL